MVTPWSPTMASEQAPPCTTCPSETLPTSDQLMTLFSTPPPHPVTEKNKEMVIL